MNLSPRVRQRLLSALALLSFFVMWELICLAGGISDLILPRPSQIAVVLWEKMPLLWPHTVQTLKTTLAGFAIGVIVGVVIGVAIGSSRLAYDVAYPLLAAALAKKQGGQAQGGADVAMNLSPEFTKAYDTFIAGRTPGGLDEHSRCLITLAVVSNPATLDRAATERTIQQALDMGIDAEEILEAMEVASLIATHAFSISMDGLAETFAARAGK